MGSKFGYEYRYRFQMDQSMIARYDSYELDPYVKFVFENRTNFIVKRIDGFGGDEIIDTERFEHGVDEHETEYGFRIMRRRLNDYWMSCDEIRDLILKALAFAREKKANPRNAPLRFIPVAIELDVCTVQKPGEQISDTFERAIVSKQLLPVTLFPDNGILEYDEDSGTYIECDNATYMSECIWTYRVQRIDEDTEVCSLCLHKTTIGALIGRLVEEGCCDHFFHCHCIVAWLMNNNSCPTCGHQIRKI